jgi:hypothetical protein
MKAVILMCIKYNVYQEQNRNALKILEIMMAPVNENRNWVCPDDYHDVDDDETGQCYPNDEECPNHYFLVPDPDPEDDGDRCARPAYYCPEHPDHPKLHRKQN